MSTSPFLAGSLPTVPRKYTGRDDRTPRATGVGRRVTLGFRGLSWLETAAYLPNRRDRPRCRAIDCGELDFDGG